MTDEADRSAFDLPADQLLELFENGEMDVEGRMPYSSNTTLLVTVTDDEDRTHRAIYKPGRGERPLWDFPSELYRREVAMYRLADALGWDVVPPTTLGIGPLGEGSVQAFVDADFEQHYFTLHEDGVGTSDLQRLCVLDLIANNTDRKSGHCLLGRDGRIYGIDHGLSFHAQFKLRTVMWDYVGQPIPAEILAAVERFVDAGPPVELTCLLDRIENDAMMARAAAVVDEARFPEDETGGHRWPWPLV
ncbi:MAG: phosphatidylinositol kinase [Actinomycetota bacterium]